MTLVAPSCRESDWGCAPRRPVVPSIYSSARTELAKLLIYGLFRKIRVLAQDGVGIMNIEGRTNWQEAAGDTDRDYAKLCLKWDVILNGPASYGRWPECQNGLRDDGWSKKKITDLRRFCEQMKDGDLVVLRRGTKIILAVGEIVSCYEHHEEFNDVDGWDIAHVRRVRWFWSNVGCFRH